MPMSSNYTSASNVLPQRLESTAPANPITNNPKMMGTATSSNRLNP